MTGSLPCTWQSMGPFCHQKINFSEPLNFGCVAVECFTSSLFYLLAIPKYVRANFRISTAVPLYENPWSFQSSQVSWISNKLNAVCSKVCRRELYHLWEIKNCTTEYHGSSWVTSVTQMQSNRPTALPRWGRISHAHTRSPPQRIPQVICCFVTFSFL